MKEIERVKKQSVKAAVVEIGKNEWSVYVSRKGTEMYRCDVPNVLQKQKFGNLEISLNGVGYKSYYGYIKEAQDAWALLIEHNGEVVMIIEKTPIAIKTATEEDLIRAFETIKEIQEASLTNYRNSVGVDY